MTNKSSLELRVLSSFDPRVKLLVEMMRRIDSKEGEKIDYETRDKAFEAVKTAIYTAFHSQPSMVAEMNAAGVDVRMFPLKREKTVEERVKDFVEVAARVIKGKHQDYIGWRPLSASELAEQMVRYVNEFYRTQGNEAPGDSLNENITSLMGFADSYFEDMANAQGEGDSSLGKKYGLDNIKAFLEAWASKGATNWRTLFTKGSGSVSIAAGDVANMSKSNRKTSRK